MTPNKNQFLLVVVILLIFHASVSADIIGMWLFEEAAGDRVIDASDENHEGKLEGGTVGNPKVARSAVSASPSAQSPCQPSSTARCQP